MRLGTTIGFRGSAERLTKAVADLERAGIEHFWTGEAYSADGVSTMGFLAAVTTSATVGSSILPIYTRTPTLLAMTAVGVDQLSGGRCILGLGASGPQVVEGFHGVPYETPLARTREIVDICRAVWRGEKVLHDGTHYRIPLPEGRGTGLGKPLRLIVPPPRADIPIYLAALGPKNVELAAEVAEGWLPLHFWPERTDVWAESLAKGVANRSPSLPPLEIATGGPLAIINDDAFQQLRDRGRRMLAFYFGGMGARSSNFYNELLCRYGYEDAAQQIQDAWLAGRHDDAMALVPTELLDGTSLVGPRGWVRQRVEAHRAAGVTILNVEPVGPNRLSDVETVRSWLD